MARPISSCLGQGRKPLAVMIGFLVATAAPLAAQAQQGPPGGAPALPDRVDTLEADVEALQGDLGALADRVDPLEAGGGALQGSLDALDERVGALETDVEALQAAPGGALADRVGALEIAVEALQGALGALAGRVGDLESDVDALADLILTLQLGDPVETDAAGNGMAGEPFALLCPDDPDDTFAIGLLGRAGIRIDQLQVQCASVVGRSLSGPILGEVIETTTVGTSLGGAPFVLPCPQGTVMSGVFGRLTSDAVGEPVGALGVLCIPFGGGPPIRQGPVGTGSAQTEFTLACAPGSVTTGIAGRFGFEFLEEIRVECRDTTF